MGRITLIILLCHAFLFAKEWRLHIKGMHCIACTIAVKKALLSVAGVKEAKVNFKTETAVVNANDGVTLKVMQNAVAATGYRAEAIQQ